MLINPLYSGFFILTYRLNMIISWHKKGYFMTRNRKLKKLENQELADSLLSEQCTLDDLLDAKAHWDMIKMSEQQKEEFMKLKRMEVFCRNLTPCIIVAEENLNGLNTYKNAEKIGLTKDMTDEQKDLLKDLSKTVNLKRFLAITRRGTSVLIMLTAIANILIGVYNKGFYNKIHPGEDYFFWGLVGLFFGLVFSNKNLTNNIAKQIYFIAKGYEK